MPDIKKTKDYKHVTVNIEIFRAKVRVHFEQSEKNFVARCNRLDPSGETHDFVASSSFTFPSSCTTGMIEVVCGPSWNIPELSHECLHAAHNVLSDIGALTHDEEVVAYIQEHILAVAMDLR